jgi:hypothetical protein
MPPKDKLQEKSDIKVVSTKGKVIAEDPSDAKRPPALDVTTFVRTQKALVEQERTTELAEEKQYRASFSEKVSVCLAMFVLIVSFVTVTDFAC